MLQKEACELKILYIPFGSVLTVLVLSESSGLSKVSMHDGVTKPNLHNGDVPYKQIIEGGGYQVN